MRRRSLLGVGWVCCVLACAAPLPQGSNSITTPLQSGIFSGTLDCEITSIVGNVSSAEPFTGPVTFEFNESGVPIVFGAPVEEGRKVSADGITSEYTRVEATATGIVIHASIEDTAGNLVGSSIATLTNEGPGVVRYQITATTFDATGTYINDCDTLLTAQ